MDYSKLSDAQLIAVHSGDYSKLSDDDLKSLHAIQSGQPAEQPGMLESGLRGAAQGASLGFADEITGGVEAAKDKLTGSDDSFADAYRKHRDESRANYDAAAEANPETFMAGQLGGGVASGIALPGGAGLKTALGLGAAYGVGDSKADLTKGDYEGVAKDAAKGAAISGVTYGVLTAATKLAPKGIKAYLGVPEDTQARYLANPEAVNSAQSIPKIAEDLPNVLAHVKEESGPLAERMNNALSTERTPEKGIPVNEVLSKLDSVLDRSNDPSKLAILQKTRDDVVKAMQERSSSLTNQFPQYMTEDELKPVIKALQDQGNWKSPILPSDQAAVTQSSGKLNSLLKESNPEYADAVGDVSQQIQVKNALIRKFGLQRDPQAASGYSPSDRTITGLRDLSKGNKIDRAAVSSELKSLGYGDLSTRVQNSLDKNAFTVGQTNGSRLTNLGATVGAGVGAFAAGPKGAIIGAGVGGAGGAYLDKVGPTVAKAILDSKLKVDALAQSKYGSIIAQAATKGSASLATTIFIMGQHDPEFRALMGGTDGQ